MWTLSTAPTSSELACNTMMCVSSLTLMSMSTAPWNQLLLGSTLSRSAYDTGLTVRGSRMSVHGSGDPSSAWSLSTRPGTSVRDAAVESSSPLQVGRWLSRTTEAMSRAARISEKTARPRTAAVTRLQRHGRHRRLGLPPTASVVVVGIDSSISSFSGPLIATCCPPSSLTLVAELSTLGRSVISAYRRLLRAETREPSTDGSHRTWNCATNQRSTSTAHKSSKFLAYWELSHGYEQIRGTSDRATTQCATDAEWDATLRTVHAALVGTLQWDRSDWRSHCGFIPFVCTSVCPHVKSIIQSVSQSTNQPEYWLMSGRHRATPIWQRQYTMKV